MKLVKQETSNEEILHVFYACDDNFIKYAMLSVNSLIDNADKSKKIHIHVLVSNASERMQNYMLKLQTEKVEISFEDMDELLLHYQSNFPIRDYYTKTTYFRMFIADMFPNIDKAIYIDSDTIVVGDITKLFDLELQDNYVGACHEQAMVQTEEYGRYVEEVCGVDRYFYFNAGMLLINCKLWREKQISTQFLNLLGVYNFVVTQDEDYLNVICKDRVLWLEDGWNTEVFGKIPCKKEDIKIVHYIMTSKPWHYEDCRLKEFFWKYAEKSELYNEILDDYKGYTDEQRARDFQSAQNLLALAVKETNREDAYYKVVRKNRAEDRELVLSKMQKMESEGVFDIDPEIDPPSKMLYPDKVDYLRKKPISKLKTKVAFSVAKRFLYKILNKKQMIVKEIIGIENWANLKSGAIITCNHFNAFDSFAIHWAYINSKHKKRKFYRVIREGNYTSFPGMYGFFMRNCNTLPLSSNMDTMKKFLKSIDQLLKDGHFILIYPEQAMWWNYRKPRPLKNGAFKFAAKNDVPVLPCFISMRDSDSYDKDGFKIQEYTINIGKPIYADKDLKTSEKVAYFLDQNQKVWNEMYKDYYKVEPIFAKGKATE